MDDTQIEGDIRTYARALEPTWTFRVDVGPEVRIVMWPDKRPLTALQEAMGRAALLRQYVSILLHHLNDSRAIVLEWGAAVLAEFEVTPAEVDPFVRAIRKLRDG